MQEIKNMAQRFNVAFHVFLNSYSYPHSLSEAVRVDIGTI